MKLCAFHLGLFQGKLTIAVNMVTLPKPKPGTKRPKLTTLKNDAFIIGLSAKS